MNPIAYLFDLILGLLNFALFIYVLLQVLIYFKVVNAYQPFVAKLWSALDSFFSPILNKIRKYLPPMQGFDISPIVVFIIISFLRYTIRYYF